MSDIVTAEFLAALLSPDAAQREQAEAYWRGFPVEQRASELLKAIPHHSNHLQQLAAVLLRRDILLLTHCPELLQALLNGLLPHFCTAPHTAIVDCLAEICAVQAVVSEKSSIDSVQSILNASLTAVTTQGHPIALKLWIALANRAPRAFCQNAIGSITEHFAAALRAKASPTLVLEAVVATAKSAQQQSSLLYGLSNQCLLPILGHSHNEEVLSTIMQHLEEAATFIPELLQPVVQQLCSFCCHSVRTSSVSIGLQAIQILVTFANDYSRVQQRNNLPLLTSTMEEVLIPYCLHTLLEFGGFDEDCWMEVSTDEEGASNEEEDDYAAQLLQDMLRLCGSSTMERTVLRAVQPCMTDPNLEWRSYRGALAALQSSAVALPVSFLKHAETTISWAVSQCASTNPAVQYNALVLLGYLLDDDFENNDLVTAIIQALAHTLQSSVPKVSSTACSVVVSLARSKADITLHLSTLLGGLSSVPSHTVARVGSVGAVAALAATAGEDFMPFYQGVMPGLCAILVQPDSDEFLSNAALEAATIVGQAVGCEVFRADALSLLQHILRQTPPLEHLVACARIASVLGEEYAPYCAAVLPHLLQLVAEATDVELSEATEQDLEATKANRVVVNEEEGTSSMTAALPGRGLTKATLNTTKIQEKALAVRAVYEHASSLGASFEPYVKHCFDILVPLLNFRYSGEIRSTSAQAVAAIYEASCEAAVISNNFSVPQTMLSVLTRVIAQQIRVEEADEMDNLYALADSLSDILYSVYWRRNDYGIILLEKFTADHSTPVVNLCMSSMQDCLSRRKEAAKLLALAGSEDELEETKDRLAIEGKLLTPLVDSVGCILKLLGSNALSAFQTHVVPVLEPFLQGGDDVPVTLSAVCLFDDCVEHCGPEAAEKFAPLLAQGAVNGLSSDNEDLIRASIYGISQIARYAPKTTLSSHINTIIPCLVSFGLDTVKEQYLSVYENAISALASLALFPESPFRGSSAIKFDTALKIFLSALPLSNDEDEARICHAGFCDLLEEASSARLICSAVGTEKIVEIIGNALAKVTDDNDVATEETVNRFTRILLQLQQQEPNMNLHSLSTESRAAINAAMNQYAHFAKANVVTP